MSTPLRIKINPNMINAHKDGWNREILLLCLYEFMRDHKKKLKERKKRKEKKKREGYGVCSKTQWLHGLKEAKRVGVDLAKSMEQRCVGPKPFFDTNYTFSSNYLFLKIYLLYDKLRLDN